jgi:DNA-binding transcriptional ArsR family regulator
LIVFRAIMRAGPQGITAGELAERAQVSPSNLSAHLTVLTNSGLVTMRRDGRRRFYAPALSTVSQLVRFLVEDCCNGHPEVCAQLPSGAETEAPRC